jgi:predicted transport protein
MPQGKMKLGKPVKEKSKTQHKALRTRKGLTDKKPKKQSLAIQLNKKLTSEIRNKIEKSVADKFHQGGGKLSILNPQ